MENEMSALAEATDPLARLHRFTVDQYERMLAAGLPVGKYGVVLLRGLLVYKERFREGHRVPYRFSVEEYHRLIELGILREDDPVELLNGEVVTKMPEGDPDGFAIERLNRRLNRVVPEEYCVRCQQPVIFPEDEPEPDFAICLPVERRENHAPRPEHVFLVLEVSESSLADDRTVKLRLYAAFGIPVYWIVNLVDRQIEVYTDPVKPPASEPRYQTQENFTAGQQVPLTIAGTVVGSIAVDAFLS
jgi:Uma2 family endonuclease